MVGLVWLSATLGGGPLEAAAIIAASLVPLVLGPASFTLLIARCSRRLLMTAAQGSACIALVVAGVGGRHAGVGLLVGAMLVVGVARALFDATAADILHQLVPLERTHDAMRALTQRFGTGQAVGIAGLLLSGLVAGPLGGIAVAALAAGVGSALTWGHHPDIDLRSPGVEPLHRAVRRGARLAVADPHLRAAVGGGAVGVATGSALSAVLILWLRDGVGLRGALVPALILGWVTIRLARPVLMRLAQRARPRTLAVAALAIQGTAAIAAFAATGLPGAALAYALSLGAGAFLATLITRARTRYVEPAMAPGVGLACGAAWALAAVIGALSGAIAAVTLGMAGTYLALAVFAAGAAVCTGLPRALRPAASGSAGR